VHPRTNIFDASANKSRFPFPLLSTSYYCKLLLKDMFSFFNVKLFWYRLFNYLCSGRVLLIIALELSIKGSQSSRCWLSLSFICQFSSLSWIITFCASLGCLVYFPSLREVNLLSFFVGWSLVGVPSWECNFLVNDLVNGILGLGISSTSGLNSTTFYLPFSLEPVGVKGTDFSPATKVSFVKECSKYFFLISVFSCCNCAMTKWAFFNCSYSSMIRLSLSSMSFVYVKAFGASLGACDVCMEGILFFVDLVTRLLGISTTSRENWSFSLSFWLVGSL